MKERRRNLTDEEKEWAIEEYQNRFGRMNDIAAALEVSRVAIHKMLKKAGVDTSKRQRIERICPVCEKPVKVRRGRARRFRDSYCDSECYFAYLETLGEDYKPSSYHCREARKIILQYFDLQPEHRGHHEDKNDKNNDLKNLRVFASQGDHVRYHRGFKVIPIWDGRKPGRRRKGK
jgi:transposase-like protein